MNSTLDNARYLSAELSCYLRLARYQRWRYAIGWALNDLLIAIRDMEHGVGEVTRLEVAIHRADSLGWKIHDEWRNAA